MIIIVSGSGIHNLNLWDPFIPNINKFIIHNMQ